MARLTKNVSYYANYARSWAKAAGPIIGGLLGTAPTTYFYDDHDQTHTASFGLAYDKPRRVRHAGRRVRLRLPLRRD